MNKQSGQTSNSSHPWWKYGHVWLVIAGPLVVVVAGFVTLYLAIRSPDPVIPPESSRKGGEWGKPAASEAAALVPAVQARNHAVTGAPPPEQAR